MRKKDPNSADGKTSEKTHFHEGKIRDEETGAQEKVLEEVAAEPGNESPLNEDEKVGSLNSSKDEIRLAKI
jgi:hypothetical protein